MKNRTRAREVVLQLLFQHDLQPGASTDAIEALAEERLAFDDLREFCLSLYAGVIERLASIDEQLAEAAENWRLSRMAVVDRNVLRLGGYEVLFTETPPKVAVNEAIEMARRYGSANSAAFVNGVLDRLLRNKASTEELTSPTE